MELSHKNRPSILQYGLAWALLAFLLLSQLFSPLALAQGEPETPPEPVIPDPTATLPPASEDREHLLRQAAETMSTGQWPGEGAVEVGVVELAGDWGLVNFRVTPPDPAEIGKTYLALAQWQDADWQIALEESAEFAAWLPQVPETLVPAEARNYLGPALSTAGYLPEFRLPFPVGQTWKYAQGPYGGPRREAVDFAPFTQHEPIDFSPPGNRERIVTAAADGVVIDRYENRLILRHAGGWETGYDSLAQASNILRVGQVIYQGQKVGLASDEIEPPRDPFVRFWLRHYSVEQTIDGWVLSGWRIIQDNSYQSGHGFGALVFENHIERVDCRTVYNYYLDPQACHITHAPPSPAAVRIDPDFIQINRGETAVTAIEAVNVTNVYSVSMLLTYNADILSVADVDPGETGTQIAPGSIFSGVPSTVTVNEELFFVDSFGRTIGFIFFEASRVAPAPAFEGIGSLAEITWIGKKDGQTRLVFGDDLVGDIFDINLELYDPSGLVLSTSLNEGEIKVIDVPTVLTVRGQVTRPGYSGSGGPVVILAGQQHQLGADGHFEVEAETGYELAISAPGYLSARVTGSPTATETSTVELGAIPLLGGDVNGDNQIDIFDMAIISHHYGQNQAQSDLTGDGVVNLFDLTLAASHYGQHGPVLITPP